MIDYNKLSKIISDALRHRPLTYRLVLDKDGWVPVESLINELRKIPTFSEIKSSDISIVIDQNKKKRHELKNGLIRAMYGHSKEIGITYIETTPPSTLYHGTSANTFPLIMKEGIKAMNRSYVHLAANKNLAFQVGYRKSKNAIVLEIDAQKAFETGIKFYSIETIWLTTFVPAKFIKKTDIHETQTN